MRKIMKYVGIFLLLFIAGGFITTKPCLAASAEVNITSDSTEVTVGDKVFVYILIDSDTLFGDFEANLLYNEEILKYTGGTSVITGGSGFLKISDLDTAQADSTRKYALEFEAIKVGSSQLSFDNQVKVYDDLGNEMSVSHNVLTLKVKAAETASDNANLKSLATSPEGLQPDFSKDIFEYNLNVGPETEKLIITALPEDEKAKVSISGNDFLEEGENKVIVNVLAESGDIIEYTINVNREKAPEEQTQPQDTIIPDNIKNTIEVQQIDGQEYIIYSGKYKLIEPGSDVIIPEGFIKTELILSDITISVYAPEDNLGSDFLLIYAMNDSQEAGFYQYDKLEKTLQRYVGKLDENKNTNTDITKNIMSSKQYHANLNKAAIVIALLSVLSALLLFVIFRLFLKLKGYKDEDLD